MQNDFNGPRTRDQGVLVDLEHGTRPVATDSTRSRALTHHVRFRMPNYGRRLCQTPHLQQTHFTNSFNARNDRVNNEPGTSVVLFSLIDHEADSCVRPGAVHTTVVND